MMITSFNSAVQGMQRIQSRQNEIAHNIANINTPKKSGEKEPNLIKDLTDQKLNEQLFTANTKVLKTQDQMLGDLIDTFG